MAVARKYKTGVYPGFSTLEMEDPRRHTLRGITKGRYWTLYPTVSDQAGGRNNGNGRYWYCV